MTETNPAEAVEPAEGTEDAPIGTDDMTVDAPTAKARKEAANYRQRLRDTEATRDQLSSTVDGLRRQLIEGQVNAAGIKPAALWSTVTVDDLLTDDGTVDAEKVTAAIETARAELGISRFSGHGDQGAHMKAEAPKVTDWAGLLKP